MLTLCRLGALLWFSVWVFGRCTQRFFTKVNEKGRERHLAGGLGAEEKGGMFFRGKGRTLAWETRFGIQLEGIPGRFIIFHLPRNRYLSFELF